MMSKVLLSSIRSLTFYKDSETQSRRGKPISQLTCNGKACKLYTPDVVRCQNAGGYGTDVDWKCEADLPEALRLGRIEVSCEGWSGPGDSYVMKESCGLEYKLVDVPKELWRDDGGTHVFPSRLNRWFRSAVSDPVSILFGIIWIAVLGILLYSFLKSCLGDSSRTRTNRPPFRPSPRPGPSSGSGSFPGHHTDTPPPYTKYANQPSNPTNPTNGEGWRPGFWTGAALGGLGTYLFNQGTHQQPHEEQRRYDWEQERLRRASATRQSWWQSSSGSAFGGDVGSSRRNNDDRGEGPSDMGRMRRSTGLGGSNVR